MTNEQIRDQTHDQTNEPPGDPVVLPAYPLPLGSWLVWGPGTALGIGLLSAGVGYGAGWYDGLSALVGGGSAMVGLLVSGVAVQPWRARDARAWMLWLFGAQMASLLLTLVAGLVGWRAMGAAIAPMGFTGAAAYLLGQLAQTSAYAQADKAIREAQDT